MGRIFVDGFEGGNGSLWTDMDGLIGGDLPTGFSGSYYFNSWSSSHYAYKQLPASKAELYFLFRIHVNDLSAGPLIVFYDSAVTKIASVRMEATTNYLALYRGGSGDTLLATGTVALANDTTYQIEVRYKPLDSGGVFQVKLDSALELDYSGDTTLGLENIQRWLIGSDWNNCRFAYDDFVVDDAGWIGNSRIQAIYPTGAGTTTQWTPSTGSNYDCVDEIPASDSNYVSTNTNDQIDLYAASNLSGTIGTVKSIQLQARCAYEGSPTPTRIQLGLRTSSANYFSASLAPPSAFGAPVTKIWETDPSGGNWDETKINALEIGVKAVAT
jgi:hypothetical protein